MDESIPDLLERLARVVDFPRGGRGLQPLRGREGILEEWQHSRSNGYLGIVPLIAVGDGDLLALKTSPTGERHCVRVDHNGDGMVTQLQTLGDTICHDGMTLAAIYGPSDELVDRYERLEEVFSEERRVLGLLREAQTILAEAAPSDRGIELARAIDPEGCWAAFDKTRLAIASEGQQPRSSWKDLTDRWPSFAPGWVMRLRCAIEDDDTEAASESAWWLLSSPWMLDPASLWNELGFVRRIERPPGISREEWSQRRGRVELPDGVSHVEALRVLEGAATAEQRESPLYKVVERPNVDSLVAAGQAFAERESWSAALTAFENAHWIGARQGRPLDESVLAGAREVSARIGEEVALSHEMRDEGQR